MTRTNKGHVAGDRSRSDASLGRSAKTVGAGRSSKSAAASVSQNVRVAAAKARVSADRKRGVKTEAWIVDLANKAS